MKRLTMLGVVGIACGLAGCGVGAKGYWAETQKVDAIAAYQLMDREQFEQFDLPRLIAAAADATTNSTTCMDEIDAITPSATVNTEGTPVTPPPDSSLGTVFACFRKATKGIDAEVARGARNSVQERILAASTQRCNAYESNLQRTFARNNFGSGLLATIAATAGALVPAADGARILSGVAGVATGYRAEFNQDYMSNLAAYVITEGIDNRRQEVYAQIQTLGQKKNLADYTLEAAVKDAIYYHGQCSVIVGFQQAADSIKLAADPGMDASLRALSKVKLAQELTSPTSTKSTADIIADLNTINKNWPTSPRNLAGSLLGSEDGTKEWTLSKAMKDVAEGLHRITQKKEDFKKQWTLLSQAIEADMTAEFNVDDCITDYDTMIDTYKKALAKIGEINTAKLTDNANCTNDSLLLDEQCNQAHRLAELDQLISNTFIALVDNRLAQLNEGKKALDLVPTTSEEARTEAVTTFSTLLTKNIDLGSSITDASGKIELLTQE